MLLLGRLTRTGPGAAPSLLEIEGASPFSLRLRNYMIACLHQIFISMEPLIYGGRNITLPYLDD